MNLINILWMNANVASISETSCYAVIWTFVLITMIAVGKRMFSSEN